MKERERNKDPKFAFLFKFECFIQKVVFIKVIMPCVGGQRLPLSETEE